MLSCQMMGQVVSPLVRPDLRKIRRVLASKSPSLVIICGDFSFVRGLSSCENASWEKSKHIKHSFIKTSVKKKFLLIETSGPHCRDNTWHLKPEWSPPGEGKDTGGKYETRPQVDVLTSQFSKLTLFKTCAQL